MRSCAYKERKKADSVCVCVCVYVGGEEERHMSGGIRGHTKYTYRKQIERGT